MAIDRNNNPMIADFASTSITSSIFSSTAFTVNQITWASVAGSHSIHLVDMDGNSIFDTIAENAINVIDDPITFANGLRFSTSIAQGAIGTGKLFVWVR